MSFVNTIFRGLFDLLLGDRSRFAGRRCGTAHSGGFEGPLDDLCARLVLEDDGTDAAILLLQQDEAIVAGTGSEQRQDKNRKQMT